VIHLVVLVRKVPAAVLALTARVRVLVQRQFEGIAADNVKHHLRHNQRHIAEEVRAATRPPSRVGDDSAGIDIAPTNAVLIHKDPCLVAGEKLAGHIPAGVLLAEHRVNGELLTGILFNAAHHPLLKHFEVVVVVLEDAVNVGSAPSRQHNHIRVLVIHSCEHF